MKDAYEKVLTEIMYLYFLVLVTEGKTVCSLHAKCTIILVLHILHCLTVI